MPTQVLDRTPPPVNPGHLDRYGDSRDTSLEPDHFQHAPLCSICDNTRFVKRPGDYLSCFCDCASYLPLSARAALALRLRAMNEEARRGWETQRDLETHWKQLADALLCLGIDRPTTHCGWIGETVFGVVREDGLAFGLAENDGEWELHLLDVACRPIGSVRNLEELGVLLAAAEGQASQ